MHDRLAQYRVNDKLKKVRSVLGRNLMALDEGPEVDFLDGLYHRQLEKSTCEMLCCYIILIKLTEKSRRASRS